VKVVILTGRELRHTFMRKAIALDANIEVLSSYCEGSEKSLLNTAKREKNDTNQLTHLLARENSEKDFFETFVKLTPDNSNPSFIAKGEINDEVKVQEIKALNPDLIIAYGCSIIKEPLVEHFEGRFLNVHLGLSPYLRGSGTNFWPLVNSQPEYVGATFMYLDTGIDTGAIIHQIRARVFKNDTPHHIGNRLIADVAKTYIDIINYFSELEVMKQPEDMKSGKYYKNSDFTPESVEQLYCAFDDGLVEKYLDIKEKDKAKIIVNTRLKEQLI